MILHIFIDSGRAIGFEQALRGIPVRDAAAIGRNSDPERILGLELSEVICHFTREPLPEALQRVIDSMLRTGPMRTTFEGEPGYLTPEEFLHSRNVEVRMKAQTSQDRAGYALVHIERARDAMNSEANNTAQTHYRGKPVVNRFGEAAAELLKALAIMDPGNDGKKGPIREEEWLPPGLGAIQGEEVAAAGERPGLATVDGDDSSQNRFR